MKQVTLLSLLIALLGLLVTYGQAAQTPIRQTIVNQPPINFPLNAPPLTQAERLALLNGMGGYGGYGGGGYGYGDMATTPLQGIDYGVARIIRSVGEGNLDLSKALINLTEAERREIENWRFWTQTYFEMRRFNREARAAERGRRPTEADFVRYAQWGKPRRLSPSELDGITGQIAWPLVLQAAELAPIRTELEKLFAQRASQGTLGLDDYLKADRLTSQMLDTLRKFIYDVPASSYTTGRSFLESLAYETRFPAI